MDFDALMSLEEHRRELLSEVEGLRASSNKASKEIAGSEGAAKESKIKAAKVLSENLKDRQELLDRAQEEFNVALAEVPNLVHPDVPDGESEEQNVVVRETGVPPAFEFEAKDHLDLGEDLGIVDVERAAKVSGSRFAFLLKEAVYLELALVRFAFDRLAGEGFTPVITPVLVREEAMFGTGFFPTDEAQVYKTEKDDLYLVGTSEVPLASMHSGEVFEPNRLPLRYAGFSTCFRREAGTYGKDMRGIVRVHQFDKVEMFSFARPEESEEEHANLLAIEESLLNDLEIPHRVMEMCAGDLGASNYRRFDLDAWLPGGNRWLEVMSVSNCTDYQARRLDIRAKAEGPNFIVHTLNGTAVAIQRTLVALFENHQQADGSISIPKKLRSYAGFDSIPANSL